MEIIQHLYEQQMEEEAKMSTKKIIWGDSCSTGKYINTLTFINLFLNIRKF